MGNGGKRAPVRGAVPVQTTRFFGRGSEAQDLVDLVQDERLLTLVGAPGCGKTRLAVEVSAKIPQHFPGGVRFVELAPVSDPGSVANAVGVALDIPEQPGRPMDDAVVETLAEARPTLVILDNCEHVLDAAADLADRVVAHCPAVSLLATSRAALGGDCERVWNVPPLDPAASAALFVDRAEATSGALQYDAADEADVAAICARLDGLPLAVELTAAWSRTLSPSQILDRLHEALTDGSRAGQVHDPRHLTMANAVEWSYRLLPPGPQALFRRLSVFVGGFDLDAVEAVASGQANVLADLRVLLEDSLVLSERTGGAPMRYRLLEPVRQFAATLLPGTREEEPVRRQHALHYMRLAQGYDPWGARGEPPTVSLVRLQQDDGNLHAAFEWSRHQAGDLGLRFGEAMASYWAFGGRIGDGLRWLDEVLTHGSPDRTLVARAMVRAALLEWRKGDYDDALTRLAAADELAISAGADLVRGHVLTILGTVELSAGAVDDAMDHCEEAIAIFDAYRDTFGSIGARVCVSWSHYARGDDAQGDAGCRALLDMASDGSNPTATAYAHFGLAYGALLRREASTQRLHMAATVAAMDDGGVVERTDWLWSSITLAALERRSQTAYRLLGGAQAFGRRRGGSRLPDQLDLSPEMFAELIEPTWRDLGPGEMELLIEEGGAMTWDELVAEALAEPDPRSPLTGREREIAELVAAGLTNVDIARKLGISRRTVESHIEHIRQKLGLVSRNEVIIWMHGGLH